MTPGPATGSCLVLFLHGRTPSHHQSQFKTFFIFSISPSLSTSIGHCKLECCVRLCVRRWPWRREAGTRSSPSPLRLTTGPHLAKLGARVLAWPVAGFATGSHPATFEAVDGARASRAARPLEITVVNCTDAQYACFVFQAGGKKKLQALMDKIKQ